MANQIKIVTFEADGSDVYIPIGFVPFWARVIAAVATNPNIYEWFRRMELDDSTGRREGVLCTGSSGALTYAPNSQGIIAYDTAAQLPTVTEWTEAVVNAATARTATARGTLVKATVGAVDQDGAVVDRSAIFECTTAGTSSATEPTWNTVPDGITTDGTAKFQIVTDKALGRIGYKGIVVAAEVAINGTPCYVVAVEGDSEDTLGDVDSWPSGVMGG
jgi:hypothetical protein